MWNSHFLFILQILLYCSHSQCSILWYKSYKSKIKFLNISISLYVLLKFYFDWFFCFYPTIISFFYNLINWNDKLITNYFSIQQRIVFGYTLLDFNHLIYWWFGNHKLKFYHKSFKVILWKSQNKNKLIVIFKISIGRMH